MGRRTILGGAVVAATLGLAATASAGTPMRSEEGVALRFRGTSGQARPHLDLVGNTLNLSGVHPESLFEAVSQGLGTWQLASENAFTFDYWQGPDRDEYTVGLERDGVSTIFFASAVGPELRLGAGTPAFTQAWIEPGSGEIEEVDVVLNDFDFEFVADPAVVRDTDDGRVLLLSAVVLHELGHGFGLDHSGVLDATMFTWSWAGQASLGCDDILAIRDRFEAPSSGQVVATLISEMGDPMFGAQLLAMRIDGRPVASATADPQGRVELGGLPPGKYTFVVEPFSAGPMAWTPGYADAGDACPSGSFLRTDVPEIHEVDGAALDLGTVAVECGEGVQFSSLGSAPTVEAAPVVLDPTEDAFAGFDMVPVSQPRYLRLEHAGGPLEVRAISHGLFSPISVRMALLDEIGAGVQTSYARPLETDPETGFTRWDARLMAEALDPGTYFLELKSDALLPTLYPGGELTVDTVPFVYLYGMRGEVSEAQTCTVSTDGLPPYVSPEGGSPQPANDPAPAGCNLGGTDSSPLGVWWVLFAITGLRRRSFGA